MKNNTHEAYRTNYNFPLHICSPDSVQAFLDDKLRLLTMLPSQWPKLRGRNITRKEYEVVDKYSFTTSDNVVHNVVNVYFSGEEKPSYGRIVDEKYVFSDDIIGMSLPLEIMFEPFTIIGCRPLVRREWSHEYMAAVPFWYCLAQVDEVVKPHRGEVYYEIEGYAEMGINCLADLLSRSFQFKWNYRRAVFESITDPYEVTKRIRKPWMQHLFQVVYGERETANADISKLVHFLFKKCEHLLTDEEKIASEHILLRDVTVKELHNISEKDLWLNKLVAAYKSEQLLTPGCNVFEDPIYSFLEHQVPKGA